MIPAALLLITSFFLFLKLIIFIACPLKNSQDLLREFLSLYTSCLFSMLLIKDIVDIGKSDGICSLSFVVEVSGVFSHPSIFFIMHSRSG